MKEKIKNLSSSYKAFKAKIIKKLEKTVNVCKIIFGYGIMLALFIGGLTLLGYIVALCVGGSVATEICAFIKEYIIKGITYLSTIMVIFGLVIMYMSGQTALSAKKSPKKTESKTNEEIKKEIAENDEGER